MSAAGKKRISQETFDDAVKENVETFGCSVAEAVKDAIEQFEATGISLDNIIKDGSTLERKESKEGEASAPAKVHPVLAALEPIGAFNIKLQDIRLKKDDTGETVDKETLDTLSNMVSGVSAAFAALAAVCNVAENRAIAGSNLGVTWTITALTNLHIMKINRLSNADTALMNGMNALRNMCLGNDENRSFVPVSSLATLQTCFQHDNPLELQRSALLCAALLCVHREDIKVHFFEAKTTRVIHYNLTNEIARAHAGLVKDSCMLLSRMLTDDDYSIMASKAYQYAREVAAEGIIQDLLEALKRHNSVLATAAEVYSALKSITVNDEICKEIDRLGGVDIVTRCLSLYVHADSEAALEEATRGLTGTAVRGAESKSALDSKSAEPTPTTTPTTATDASTTTATAVEAVITAGGDGSTPKVGGGAVTPSAEGTPSTPAETATAQTHRMVRCGMSVLRAVANSDAVKVKMCDGEGATMKLMLDTLAAYSSSGTVMEQAIGAVGNLCLRLLGNCTKIATAGGMRLIAEAMRRNPDHAGVQRSGCLAIRNLVVRDAGRVALAFEEGCEPLLQQAYLRHPTCRDVAYACLRDLGCSYAETTIGRAAAERAQRAADLGDIRVK